MDVSVPEQYSTALSPYEDSKWTTCEENIWIYRHRLFVPDAILWFRNCNSIPRPLVALVAVSEVTNIPPPVRVMNRLSDVSRETDLLLPLL
jgi:hypothetical protein